MLSIFLKSSSPVRTDALFSSAVARTMASASPIFFPCLILAAFNAIAVSKGITNEDFSTNCISLSALSGIFSRRNLYISLTLIVAIKSLLLFSMIFFAFSPANEPFKYSIHAHESTKTINFLSPELFMHAF